MAVNTATLSFCQNPKTNEVGWSQAMLLPPCSCFRVGPCPLLPSHLQVWATPGSLHSARLRPCHAPSFCTDNLGTGPAPFPLRAESHSLSPCLARLGHAPSPCRAGSGLSHNPHLPCSPKKSGLGLGQPPPHSTQPHGAPPASSSGLGPWAGSSLQRNRVLPSRPTEQKY